MDDTLERPSPNLSIVSNVEQGQDDEQSSDDDNNGLDWTRFPSNSNALLRPVIPKRGDKEFEPNVDGESALQMHNLERVRSAMLNALNVTRSSNSKNISYGVWVPSLSRAHVTVARGIHFSSMGYSVPRGLPREDEDPERKMHKRLELLPEEALYLIERGSMFCWENKFPEELNPADHSDDVVGAPMTVQQAYAEIIGNEGLTLERYQAYSYLKRLGYTVTRTKPPDFYYPCASKHKQSLFTNTQSTFFKQTYNMLTAKLKKFVMPKFNWWRPLRLNVWWNDLSSYPLIFQSLRLITTGHDKPISPHKTKYPYRNISTAYEIFFNVYKPTTAFRKTAPPPEDFSLVVINARETPLPTLHELSGLFNKLPALPPPVPRRAQFVDSQSATSVPGEKTCLLHWIKAKMKQLFQFYSWLVTKDTPEYKAKTHIKGKAKPGPNPFQMLKLGKKQVVVAVVDAGTMSFFRFGEGAFEEWPMQ